MRLLCIFLLALAGALSAAESAPTFPLWDNVEPVSEYAKRVNLPPTQMLDLGNGVKLELVLIPAGKFTMGTPEPLRLDSETYIRQGILGVTLLVLSAGSLLALLILTLIRARQEKRRPQVSLGRLVLMTVLAGGTVLSGMHGQHIAKAYQEAVAEHAASIARYEDAQSAEKPAHKVTLTKPFYMGKFAVTQEQYQTLMGLNPSSFNGKDNPVERVSWGDTQEFCKKLSEQTKQTIRLPTEAEWEYSCRAGTVTTYYSGDTEADLARVAWYNSNSKGRTHPVGQKEPNKFELYDMQGCVSQWCQDWYSEDYSAKSEAENPSGPTQGFYRSLRGSSWDESPVSSRLAARGNYDVASRSYGLGFRVVLVPAFRTP